MLVPISNRRISRIVKLDGSVVSFCEDERSYRIYHRIDLHACILASRPLRVATDLSRDVLPIVGPIGPLIASFANLSSIPESIDPLRPWSLEKWHCALVLFSVEKCDRL